MSKKGLRVEVTDLETGTKETVEVPVGEYFILATEPCHVAHVNAFANGTHVLTIKGRVSAGIGVLNAKEDT